MTVATYRRLLRRRRASARRPAPRRRGRRRSGSSRAGRSLVEELEGIAAGAGQDVLELLAINARTELLAARAASARSSAPTSDAEPRADLGLAPRPRRRDGAPGPSHQPGGRWFTTVTEAGILAKLGCTSTRARVRAELPHVLGGRRRRAAYRSTCCCGWCSSAATDVDERARAAAGARTSASSCITLRRRRRGRFAAELSPRRRRGSSRPDADGWLVHTNHFLAGARRRGRHARPREQPGHVRAP